MLSLIRGRRFYPGRDPLGSLRDCVDYLHALGFIFVVSVMRFLLLADSIAKDTEATNHSPTRPTTTRC